MYGTLNRVIPTDAARGVWFTDCALSEVGTVPEHLSVGFHG